MTVETTVTVDGAGHTGQALAAEAGAAAELAGTGAGPAAELAGETGAAAEEVDWGAAGAAGELAEAGAAGALEDETGAAGALEETGAAGAGALEADTGAAGETGATGETGAAGDELGEVAALALVTGTTTVVVMGEVEAGQLVTLGAQLVMVTWMVWKMVDSSSAVEAGTAAAADEDGGAAVVAGTSGWPSALSVTAGDEAC